MHCINCYIHLKLVPVNSKPCVHYDLVFYLMPVDTCHLNTVLRHCPTRYCCGLQWKNLVTAQSGYEITCLCPVVHCLKLQPCLYFTVYFSWFIFASVTVLHIVASFSIYHISTSGWGHYWPGGAPPQRGQASRRHQTTSSV